MSASIKCVYFASKNTSLDIVQNYLTSFGLYPSSRMWKFYKRPQRFGDWICLRPQMDGAG
jgi:hypothetical protein